MCPVAATFIGLLVVGAITVLGLPIFINMYESGKQWMKNRPRTNSFGSRRDQTLRLPQDQLRRRTGA